MRHTRGHRAHRAGHGVPASGVARAKLQCQHVGRRSCGHQSQRRGCFARWNGFRQRQLPKFNCAAATECAADRRHHQIDDRRRRYDRTSAHDMVGEPRRQIDAESHIPLAPAGVRRRLDAGAEERMHRVADGNSSGACQLGRGVIPESLALPRIERQRHDVTTLRYDAAPVDRSAGSPQRCHHRGRSLQLVALPLATGHRHHLASTLVGGLRHGIAQHGVRPEFNKRRDAIGNHRVDRARELHRLPKVAAPVVRCEVGTLSACRQHSRVQRHCTITRHHVGQRCNQFRYQRIHLRAVRRDIHFHQSRIHAVAIELGEKVAHRIGCA